MFRRWLSLCLMLAVAGILRAQETPGDTALSMVSPDSLEVVEKADSIGKKKRVGFIRKFIQAFSDKDSTYITPDYYNYTALLQNTNFRQDYRLRATNKEGQTQTIHLTPRSSFNLGPYFGWRWIFLGYTFDVGRPKSAGKTSEFNFSFYTALLGFDLQYIKHNGGFEIKNVDGFGSTRVRNVNFNGLDTKTMCLNAYYVFNHRRFSYPAAYAQSTVQAKSAGSWVLGVRVDRQKLDFDHTQLPSALLSPSKPDEIPIIDELKFKELDYYHYSISAGYAYNWVFAPKFLFSVSLVPALGYKKLKGRHVSGEEFWMNVKNLNIDLISRAGLVWNNSRWFAGASFVNYLYGYRKDKFSITNSVSYLNVYAGFYFKRRR